jgi:GT2 family glycosyltransferase
MAEMSNALTPWVRIVIVNYNGGALLQSCLEALAGQTMPDFEAVIVDNASAIFPITGVRLPDTRFHVRQAGSNVGFAAGNNLGVKGCKSAWIATLNPDTRPRAEWLSALRAATDKYPWATMFGSTQLNMENPEIVDGFGDVLSASTSAWRSGNGRSIAELPASDCEVFSPCAAAALYARHLFQREGGFDESFFCYLEDVDLGFRLHLRGERCVQVRRAEVLHVGSATTGHLSDFSVFYSYRNRIWLFIKNAPGPLLIPILALQTSTIALSLARPGARIYRPSALRGLWASLKGLPQVVRSRKQVQRRRLASTWQIARAMVWNPLKARPKGRIVFRRLLPNS